MTYNILADELSSNLVPRTMEDHRTGKASGARGKVVGGLGEGHCLALVSCQCPAGASLVVIKQSCKTDKNGNPLQTRILYVRFVLRRFQSLASLKGWCVGQPLETVLFLTHTLNNSEILCGAVTFTSPVQQFEC